MSIRSISGVLGAGKGQVTIRLLVKELREGFRVILTNFAVEMEPWINGAGKLQYGLLAYIKYELKDMELYAAAERRVFRVSDDEMPHFFLLRAVKHGDEGNVVNANLYQKGLAYDIYKTNAVYSKPKTEHDEPKVIKFDTVWMSIGSMCYIVDEAWKFWPAREWDTTSKAFVYYAAHSRKNGDDLWVAMHSVKDMDSAIVRKMQEFHSVTNRGKRMLLNLWRQPADIRVNVTSHAPTGSKSDNVMQTYGFTITGDRIAECYDTTCGVGLKGRMVGDLKEKPQGMPYWTLITSVIALPITFFALLGWFLIHQSRKHGRESQDAIAPKTWNQMIVSNVMERGENAKAGFQKKFGNLRVATSAGSSYEHRAYLDTNEIFTTGWAFVDGKPEVMLNNGDVLYDDELKQINRREAIGTDGIHYRLHPAPKGSVNQHRELSGLTIPEVQSPSYPAKPIVKREPTTLEIDRAIGNDVTEPNQNIEGFQQ